jgi:hypothetical protein
MILKSVLQNYSILRHVPMVTTTITRERSQTVLSWNNAALKHSLSCCVPIITVSISAGLGNRWVCCGVEIVEHRKNTVMVGGCPKIRS